MDDRQLIQKVKEGDEIAFRSLFEEYNELVFKTCIGFLHNKEDAEDVTQEVFVELYRSAHTFRSEAKVSTWLYRISVNKSLNFIRDNKKRNLVRSLESISGFHLQKSSSDQSDDLMVAESELLHKQKIDLINKLLGSLPKNQQIAFTLNKYNNLSYKQVAEVMDVSVSSVESLIHRAKKNIQKNIVKQRVK